MILGETQEFASPAEALAHISEAAWSDFTKSDYTLEQWHAACIIHIHDGAPTSKSQCKLPVKTPDGVLNRNGVHAAAAALAGARGGLKGVSADQKKTAANALKRYYAQLDEDPPESLSQSAISHHGVKGMRWGVRKEEDTDGGGGSSSAQAAEYHRLADDIVSNSGLDSHMMAAKYGPESMQARVVEAKRQADREKLKKIAIAGGVTLGAVAAGVAIYKVNQAGGFDNLPGMNLKKLLALETTNIKAYSDTADGLHINWEKGVNLPKGSILKRLSTVAETDPRPGGFYAAFRDEDVNSYKAILPTFWKQWGVGDPRTGGFLNHYMAKEAIRAPSGKESFGIFKELLGTNDSFKELSTMWLSKGLDSSDAEIKELFFAHAQSWADPNDAAAQEWFKEMGKRGFNALIDFNDAGKLGKTPLRVIDGNMFDIVKNEPQTLNDFYTAAKKWSPELIHVYTLPNGEFVLIHVDDFLSTVERGREAVVMISG